MWMRQIPTCGAHSAGCLAIPLTGAAVSDTWSTPVIVSRFGSDGFDGIDGADAVDGNGVEYVFTVTSGASLASSRRPANSWGYDEPSTNGGQTWDDGAPNVTATNPYLWRSQRRVPGDPAVGTAVSDTWSTPVIVSRFGSDGTAGIDGTDATDGNGVEYVFTVTSSATLASSRRPLNSWGYDSPATVNSQQWDDGAPNIDASRIPTCGAHSAGCLAIPSRALPSVTPGACRLSWPTSAAMERMGAMPLLS